MTIHIQYQFTDEAIEANFEPIPKCAKKGDAGGDLKLFIPLTERKTINELVDEASKMCTSYCSKCDYNKGGECLSYELNPLINKMPHINYSCCYKYKLAQYINTVGVDKESNEYLLLSPGETKLCHTGLKVAMSCDELDYVPVLKIYPRSGLSVKKGVILANTVGIVDSGYRGEIMLALKNSSNFPVLLKSGERVAQMLVSLTYNLANYDIVCELSNTDRCEGGFGSTGNC